MKEDLLNRITELLNRGREPKAIAAEVFELLSEIAEASVLSNEEKLDLVLRDVASGSVSTTSSAKTLFNQALAADCRVGNAAIDTVRQSLEGVSVSPVIDRLLRFEIDINGDNTASWQELFVALGDRVIELANPAELVRLCSLPIRDTFRRNVSLKRTELHGVLVERYRRAHNMVPSDFMLSRAINVFMGPFLAIKPEQINVLESVDKKYEVVSQEIVVTAKLIDWFLQHQSGAKTNSFALLQIVEHFESVVRRLDSVGFTYVVRTLQLKGACHLANYLFERAIQTFHGASVPSNQVERMALPGRAPLAGLLDQLVAASLSQSPRYWVSGQFSDSTYDERKASMKQNKYVLNLLLSIVATEESANQVLRVLPSLTWLFVPGTHRPQTELGKEYKKLLLTLIEKKGDIRTLTERVIEYSPKNERYSDMTTLIELHQALLDAGADAHELYSNSVFGAYPTTRHYSREIHRTNSTQYFKLMRDYYKQMDPRKLGEAVMENLGVLADIRYLVGSVEYLNYTAESEEYINTHCGRALEWIRNNPKDAVLKYADYKPYLREYVLRQKDAALLREIENPTTSLHAYFSKKRFGFLKTTSMTKFAEQSLELGSSSTSSSMAASQVVGQSSSATSSQQPAEKEKKQTWGEWLGWSKPEMSFEVDSKAMSLSQVPASVRAKLSATMQTYVEQQTRNPVPRSQVKSDDMPDDLCCHLTHVLPVVAVCLHDGVALKTFDLLSLLKLAVDRNGMREMPFSKVKFTLTEIIPAREIQTKIDEFYAAQNARTASTSSSAASNPYAAIASNLPSVPRPPSDEPPAGVGAPAVSPPAQPIDESLPLPNLLPAQGDGALESAPMPPRGDAPDLMPQAPAVPNHALPGDGARESHMQLQQC